MVPEEYRPRIASMVKKSFQQKGSGRKIEDFTEAMALSWLARRRAFNKIGETHGLEQEVFVGQNSERGILALTESGSIVAIAGGKNSYTSATR